MGIWAHSYGWPDDKTNTLSSAAAAVNESVLVAVATGAVAVVSGHLSDDDDCWATRQSIALVP